MIVHHPLSFVGATLSDFLRYFTPDATPYNDAVSATSLPRSAGGRGAQRRHAAAGPARAEAAVRSPAGFVRAYRSVMHVPRPVLALLALAARAGGVPARARDGARSSCWPAARVMILLGTAATGGFALRYLLPAVPLLAIGGGIALAAAARARAPWRRAGALVAGPSAASASAASS